MKKHSLKIYLFIIFIFLLFIFYCDYSSYHIKESSNINSPIELSNWLTYNIRYEEDEEFDCWQSPNKTIERKIGDCEDYAILSYYVLKYQLKYKPIILILLKELKEKNCHCVTVFKNKDGYWNMMDCNILWGSKIKNLKKFVYNIYSEYNYIMITNEHKCFKGWVK